MKIAFFVNRVETEISEYTTTRIARTAASRGHEVWYVGVGHVDHEADGELRARGHKAAYGDGDDLESFLLRIQDRSPESIVLEDFDAVWLRNDAIEDMHERSWAAPVGVVFGQMLTARGVTVINDPLTLARAGSKLYLHEFPASIRPRSIVTRHFEEVRDFVARVGRSVVKPLYGAKGRNVFMIDDVDETNLKQMIEAVLEDGYVIAQEFVPGGDDGDVRLFFVEGEPLQEDGTHAIFRRVPKGADPRANISAGARPKEATFGDAERKIAAAMKDKLIEDGMFFVGVDIIGDKVVEINGESPGGFQSTEHLTGIDFAATLCEALERRLS